MATIKLHHRCRVQIVLFCRLTVSKTSDLKYKNHETSRFVEKFYGQYHKKEKNTENAMNREI